MKIRPKRLVKNPFLFIAVLFWGDLALVPVKTIWVL